MDTLRAPTAVASLVAGNLAPLAGIVLFGWSPANLLLLYLVDTFLAFGVVVLLVMAHVTGNDEGRPLAGWKDWAKACCGLALLGAIMAFPLALPVLMVIGDELDVAKLAADRGFVGAIGAQVAMSGYAAMRQHRDLNLRNDDDRVLAGRLFFLVARWIAMFVAIVTGLVPMLGPRIGGFVLVAVYGAASVYFELFPERAQRLVRGKGSKPIAWDGDLDAQEARRKAALTRRGDAPGGQR